MAFNSACLVLNDITNDAQLFHAAYLIMTQGLIELPGCFYPNECLSYELASSTLLKGAIWTA